MNNIIMVEGIKELANNTFKIIYPSDTKLDISENIHYLNSNPLNYNLYINIKDNVTFKFDKYEVLRQNTEINITMANNATLEMNLLIINWGINELKLTLNMIGNNSKAVIKVRAINQNVNNKVLITCDGVIAKNTLNNELTEDLKGLVYNDSTIEINPNIDVATNEVIANHLVTIGSFKEEELFYLKSKGLNEKTAKKLLINSFIYANLNKHLKEYVDTEVINFE